jgi:hypothetical protein
MGGFYKPLGVGKQRNVYYFWTSELGHLAARGAGASRSQAKKNRMFFWDLGEKPPCGSHQFGGIRRT